MLSKLYLYFYFEYTCAVDFQSPFIFFSDRISNSHLIFNLIMHILYFTTNLNNIDFI